MLTRSVILLSNPKSAPEFKEQRPLSAAQQQKYDAASGFVSVRMWF
ncbi:MAG: hypothetical protein O3B11_03640 [Bacteroidetes bacterium]|nr:hypothetical protein [Bacteroidota bacterium]